MNKWIKRGMALLLAVSMINITSTSVMAKTFSVAANGVRLRQNAGLGGKLVAYLGQGDIMEEYFNTGVIDNQVWRFGKMLTRDVAGLKGYASAAYLR